MVESSPLLMEGVSEITGLHFDSVVLFEPLPVEDKEIFAVILNLTQLLDKYELKPNKIYFDPEMRVTLYFNEARVRLGDDQNINEKIMQLPEIVPHIIDKKGLIDMSSYDENTLTLTFEEDD